MKHFIIYACALASVVCLAITATLLFGRCQVVESPKCCRAKTTRWTRMSDISTTSKQDMPENAIEIGRIDDEYIWITYTEFEIGGTKCCIKF